MRNPEVIVFFILMRFLDCFHRSGTSIDLHQPRSGQTFSTESHTENFIQGSHTFLKNIFNTKCKELSTITSLHFSKFLIMKLNSTHCINNEVLCLQYNSAQILEISFPFRNATLFQSLMYILAKYNTFSSLETQF